jgi:hypothetical protein
MVSALKTMREKFTAVQTARRREAGILEQVVTQNDRAKILRKIAEVVEKEPRLKKVESTLMEAPTMADLDRSIKLLTAALASETSATPKVEAKPAVAASKAVSAETLLCMQCGEKAEATAKRMSQCVKCKRGRVVSESVARRLAALNSQKAQKTMSIPKAEPVHVESVQISSKPSEVAQEITALPAATAVESARKSPLMESVRAALARRGMK